MGIISSDSLWTELIPILSEGGKGDTTCKTRKKQETKSINKQTVENIATYEQFFTRINSNKCRENFLLPTVEIRN